MIGSLDPATADVIVVAGVLIVLLVLALLAWLDELLEQLRDRDRRREPHD